MGETNITVNCEFADEEAAADFSSNLKLACKENQYDLGQSLSQLLALEVVNDIRIESIESKNSSIFISCYGGRHIEQPVWFVEALYSLGASRTEITSQCDDSFETFYFIQSQRVNKGKFFDQKKPDYASELNAEELDCLFLPKGMTKVSATLIVSCEEANEWKYFYILKMETNDGKEFYYKGDSELADLARYNNKYEKNCTFVAKFELDKYKGKISSFAKRPTKIELIQREGFLSKLLPKASCPYCGKPLRTIKAKQCMHCFESWHNQ
jgi:hypothetical protein